MYISLIIPVYNRPQETEELLASLALQTRSDFEVVLVEDGSSPELSSEAVADAYRNRLRIRYVWQPNGGPAAARPARDAPAVRNPNPDLGAGIPFAWPPRAEHAT